MMIGIVVGNYWPWWWIAAAAIVVAATVHVALLVAGHDAPMRRLTLRPWFTVPVALTGFALGQLAMSLWMPSIAPPCGADHKHAVGEVRQLVKHDFSMTMVVELQWALDSSRTAHSLPPTLIDLSTRGCDYTLHVGDVVAWPCALQPVRNMGNPCEVDRVALMRHQGIAFTQHIGVKELWRVGHRNSLMSWMAQQRARLIQRILVSDLSPVSQHFLVAVMMGDRQLIDSEQRDTFAHAGIAHVLALSGLHVGIIAMLFWWLLFPLDFLGRKKWRLAVTLLCIAAYATFTGLSPSVVRASIMVGFTMGGVILYRRTHALNALVVAALLILTVWPASLFAVGFQMSFITVAALLMAFELFDTRWHLPTWANYVCSTLVSSSVASITTLALAAHYFHSVPLLGAVTNLLVLPAMPIVMVVGSLCLLTAGSGMGLGLLGRCFDALCSYVDSVARWVATLPMSHIGSLDVTTTAVWLYFAALILIVWWLRSRRGWLLVATGAVLATMAMHSAWIDWRTPHRGLVVFNDYSSTPVLQFDGDSAWLWCPDATPPDVATFTRRQAGFIARHHIAHITPIDTCGAQWSTGAVRPPYAMMQGWRMMAIGSGKWKNRTADAPDSTVNLLLVTKRYHGDAVTLHNLYPAATLVFSGDIYPDNLSPLTHQADTAHIASHALATRGALVIAANGE